MAQTKRDGETPPRNPISFFSFLLINLSISAILTATIVFSFIGVHEAVHIWQALLIGDTPMLGFFDYGKIIFISHYKPFSEIPAYLISFSYLFLMLYSFHHNVPNSYFSKAKGAIA